MKLRVIIDAVHGALRYLVRGACILGEANSVYQFSSVRRVSDRGYFG